MPYPPGYFAPPRQPSSLPSVPRQYHEFYRSETFRAWKPLLSLGGMLVGGFVVIIIFSLIALMFGGIYIDSQFQPQITLFGFVINNISLAACIPLALLLHWLVFRQRIGWFFSIVGRFRWGLLGRCLLLILPFELAALGSDILYYGLDGLNLAWQPDGWGIVVAILLTTPFQCAAEEVVCRGLVFRSIGSWLPSRWAGLAVAGVVSAAFFMLMHGAGDAWLNGYYFGIGLLTAVLVWRTGDLEAAIAFHVVHNLIAESMLPFQGFASLFNREAGVGSPWILVSLGLCIAATALIVWQARRMQLPVEQAVTELK